jgi:uncharacterized protein (TIGR02452 family)
VYSPRLLVFREAIARAHGLIDLWEPKGLPVVSVVSVARVCLPELVTVKGDAKGSEKETYEYAKDKEMMRENMRAVLRVAAEKGRTRVVLWWLGCGTFMNPRWEVAELWRGVLGETECACRWEDVVFAVLGKENFKLFEECLSGVVV